ncbi:hypothetical protein TWF281_006136 [Arthrobotrys megalospora]
MAGNDNIFTRTIASHGTPFSRRVWGAILILFVLLWVSLCVIGAIFDRVHRERKQTRVRPSMYTSPSHSEGFGSSGTGSGSSDEEPNGSKATNDTVKKKKKGKKVRFKLRESPRNKQLPT